MTSDDASDTKDAWVYKLNDPPIATLYDAYHVWLDDIKNGRGECLRYGTAQGLISFMSDTRYEKYVTIHTIYVRKELQRKGIFRGLLRRFKKEGFERISIVGCTSHNIYDCLGKFKFEDSHIPFFNHGGDFIWQKDGKYCKCHFYDAKNNKVVELAK